MIGPLVFLWPSFGSNPSGGHQHPLTPQTKILTITEPLRRILSSPGKRLKTLTFVPVCQYSFGRKWTSPPLNQYQVPTCGGVLVTSSRFSTLARSSVGTLEPKRTTTGMATP